MEALWGAFAFLWSLNCSQKQTLSKRGVKMEQAVWPRAAVIWARCRNDTGLVEQYHPGSSVQGVNLVSEPIRRCCVSACTRRTRTFFPPSWNRTMKPVWGNQLHNDFTGFTSARSLVQGHSWRLAQAQWRQSCMYSCVMVHCHMNEM